MEEEYQALLAAAAAVEGPWKMAILYWLGARPVLRYSALKRALGGVSHRALSAQLKALERDGLVERREYPQVPPKVEYSLTDQGRALAPALQALAAWGREWGRRQSLESPPPGEKWAEGIPEALPAAGERGEEGI